MRRIMDYSLQSEKNRSYMRAIRNLLGLNQIDVVRGLQDDRVIRESEVSQIEGKTGYNHLWYIYASYFAMLIEESGHTETVKEVMRVLLKEWKEA